MEITIDNCIDELNWIKTTGVYPYGNTQDKLHTDDYIDTVIGILCKYQKVEDIYYHQSGEALENSLRAVIEDGKDE